MIFPPFDCSPTPRAFAEEPTSPLPCMAPRFAVIGTEQT